MPIEHREIDGQKLLVMEMGKGDVGIYHGKGMNPILMFKNIPKQDLNKLEDDEPSFKEEDTEDFILGIGFSNPISVGNMISSLIKLQKKLLIKQTKHHDNSR